MCLVITYQMLGCTSLILHTDLSLVSLDNAYKRNSPLGCLKITSFFLSFFVLDFLMLLKVLVSEIIKKYIILFFVSFFL